jgi:hypothetical protein
MPELVKVLFENVFVYKINIIKGRFACIIEKFT